MKARYLIALAYAVTILAACTREMQPSPVGSRGAVALDVSVSFQTKAAGGACPVTGVRVIAFDEAGQCTLNRYMTSGYTIWTSETATVVYLNNPLTMGLSGSTQYDVNVVLNEDGFSLEGTGSTLTSLLDGIRVGSRSQQVFQSYKDARIEFTPIAATGEEPACPMTVSKSITVPEGSSRTAYNIYFTSGDDSSLRRSMARITVDRITSEAADGMGYISTTVPRILIQKVELVNIPSGLGWSSSDASLGAEPISIDFAGENASGYYDRVWNGVIWQTWAVNTDRIRTTGAKYYIMDGKDAKEWAFNASNPYLFAKDKFGDAQGALKKINYKDGAFSPNVISGLDGIFASSSDVTGTTYSVTGWESGLEASVSDEFWTVDLSKSYFVPENVSSTVTDATCIHVRATIGIPGLNLEHVDASTFSDMVSGYTPTSTYYKIGDASMRLSDYNNAENMKTAVQNAFTQGVNGHVTHYDDESVEGYKDEKYTNGYRAFVQGFSEWSSGTATVPVSSFVPGSRDVWTPGGKVCDFYIPVNNKQFGGDYSVHRNTEYTVILHVEQSTYDYIDEGNTTKASAVPFRISAEVECKKIDGDED